MTELRGVIKARGIRFSGPFLFVTFIIMALGRKFFERSTLWVAKSILGKKLVRIYRGRRVEGIITETEAYVGPEDRASHASRGKTKRTEAMFGEAGTVYVYLIYGMHYCLNIVTDKKEYPAAVLIRGIGVDGKLINGPGRVCRFMRVDKTLNKKPLSQKSGIWIAAPSGRALPRLKIVAGKRIGVDYAGKKWAGKPWRFFIKV